jgi:glycerophosphoryl diester phosphodiesterase
MQGYIGANRLMKKYDSFYDLYKKAGRPVVTAHGTNIGHAPANSIIGVKSAVDMGCDFVEFDLRISRDGIPVLQHNVSLKATANVEADVYDLDLADLKKLNFSHWQYFPDASGRTLAEPQLPECPITTFQEVLEAHSKDIFMNIQVYERDQKGLESICAIYKEFAMYERAFLTMDNFEEADRIRAIDPDIPLCILCRVNGRTTMAGLHTLHDYGCFITQPTFGDITPEYCETSRKLGIISNVYYANYERNARYLIECGVDGILTDYPEVILPLVNNKGI